MKKFQSLLHQTVLVLLISLSVHSIVFTQCSFSTYGQLKVFPGVSSTFVVDEVSGYASTFDWDCSNAPATVSFDNPTFQSIDMSIDPLAESNGFWLYYSYVDMVCTLNDSIWVQILGADQFDWSFNAGVMCSDDLGCPIIVETDLPIQNMSYHILNTLGEVIYEDVDHVPLDLSPDEYLLQISWDDFDEPCPICLVWSDGAILLPFYVGDAAEQPVLSCNDLVQVSLDEACSFGGSIDAFLEGPIEGSTHAYIISCFDGLEPVAELDGAYLSETLTFMVEHPCSGNACWGNVLIEDKTPPYFDVNSQVVELICGDDSNVAAPIAIDFCDPNPQVNLVSSLLETFDCASNDGLVSIQTDVYMAIDASGNQSESFEQKIYTYLPALDEIILPNHWDGIQHASLTCSQANEISPFYTGYPEVFGQELLTDQAYCGISLTYSDQMFDLCADGFGIIRTWTIIRSCGMETEILDHIQIIKVEDQLPPYIECPNTLEVSVGAACLLEHWVPNLLVVDDCSGVTYQVTGSNWLVQEGEELPALELGQEEISITATDVCGNSSDCDITLELVDGISPTPICIEFLEVSLNSDGIAILDPDAVDNGSYDNCTMELSYALRKMGGIYASTLAFDCSEVNESTMIELQVIDEAGWTNSCMVDILIVDKISPIIECPEIVSADCSNLADWQGLWEEPNVYDNCSTEVTVIELDSSNVDYNCLTGSISRQLMVTDASGNSASCTQFIQWNGVQALLEVDIQWPEDIYLDACAGVVYSPDSIGLEMGFPIFLNWTCGMLGMNFEDQVFYTNDEVCFKVVRSWSVIDWCSYDPEVVSGIFEHTQIVEVVDNQAPVVDCNIVPFVKLDTPDCFGEVIFDLPYILEECSPEVTIDVQSIFGSGPGPFQDVGLGTYEVTYLIADGCGNTSICVVDYMVSDAKEPTAYCTDELIIDLPVDQTVSITASDFDFASFDNCTQEEMLSFSFSILPFDSIQTFGCEDLGSNDLEMYVFDAEGNFDKCDVSLIVQDNMNYCGMVSLSLAGQVIHNDIPKQEVLVELNGTAGVLSVHTDQQGLYQFDSLHIGGDYSIVPALEDDMPISSYLTTFDLVLVTQHILGMQVFDDPLKWIAADVNDSGTISTLDIVAMRKVILQIDTDLPCGKKWKFIPTSFDFGNGGNPLNSGYVELININDLAESELDLNFYAIRMGDLNGQ